MKDIIIVLPKLSYKSVCTDRPFNFLATLDCLSNHGPLWLAARSRDIVFRRVDPVARHWLTFVVDGVVVGHVR
jgi:hypothetical protein